MYWCIVGVWSHCADMGALQTDELDDTRKAIGVWLQEKLQEKTEVFYVSDEIESSAAMLR